VILFLIVNDVRFVLKVCGWKCPCLMELTTSTTSLNPTLTMNTGNQVKINNLVMIGLIEI